MATPVRVGAEQSLDGTLFLSPVLEGLPGGDLMLFWQHWAFRPPRSGSSVPEIDVTNMVERVSSSGSTLGSPEAVLPPSGVDRTLAYSVDDAVALADGRVLEVVGTVGLHHLGASDVVSWTAPQSPAALNAVSAPEPSGEMEFDASAAQMTSGRIVFAWEGYRVTSGGSTTVLPPRFVIENLDGSPATPVLSVPSTAGVPARDISVAALSGDRAVLAWGEFAANDLDVRAVIVDGAGQPVSPVLRVDPAGSVAGGPAVAALKDGRFVVAWTELTLAGNAVTDADVKFQIFAGDGSKIGEPTVANTTTAGAHRIPQIAALQNGGFVVTWQSGTVRTPDANNSDILENTDVDAQVFDAAGAKLGDEFRVNTSSVDEQSDYTIAGLADGRFAIAWVSQADSGTNLPSPGQSHLHLQVFEGNVVAGTVHNGTDGNDDLAGSPGVDIFPVTAGNDSFHGEDGADLADYSSNSLAQAVYVSLHQGIASDARGGVDLLFSIENAAGGAGADAIVGSTAANVLTGNGGADLVFGGDFAADGSLLPNSGNDTLDGGDGNDGLWGADGNDVLRGGAGSDGLVGGAGNDSLDGGDGVDFLFGGDFSAVDGSFVPNSGDDTLNGGNGNDGLWGFDGNDVINGNAGDDYAEGGLGNDAISGGADNDTLLGQAGADTIGGGAGFDYLYGGAGADVFVFNKGDSYDTVWDFSAAEGDKIRLDPAFGIATLADLQSHLSGFTFEGADYTVIDFAGSVDKLTIKGIAAAAFTLGLLDA